MFKFIKEQVLMLGFSGQNVLVENEALAMKALSQSIKLNTVMRFFISGAFIAGFVLFKFVFQADFNLWLAVTPMIFIFLYTLIPITLLKTAKMGNVKQLSRFYFIWLVIDFIAIVIVFYAVGGPTWISIFAFSYYITFCYFTFSRKKALFFLFEICLLFSAVVLLEAFGKIPFEPFFKLDVALPQNLNFVLASLISGLLLLFFSAQWSYRLSQKTKLLQDESIKLKIKTVRAEEAKTVYKAQVRVRTQELEKLTNSLEGKVKARTNELQKRIQEFERFYSIMVGREMKMIELKKELKELRRLNNIKLPKQKTKKI